ncbi:MAG TPA: 16S rRNA (guanine(527)-N(7))-methyltransferase RsmG [Burkholderiales bacterium]|jgi:16S rRNA (guanine527-N7)-methyltransferase|nr:16S rRNA (guanine(527)-N(7))-methyltransferase RsmG [Burkholderiales bacterium]
MTPHQALDRGLAELGFELPGGARDKLLQYVALLEKWNRTFNLTAIREPGEMVSHHLLDSLVVAPHLRLSAGARIADVGSGAGLPGIPLAIACPHWDVTLNDSNTKKTAFMRQAAIELHLANVSVHEGRVQGWNPAQRFAAVISRAFAEFSEFIAACRHLVAPGGVLAAMKGAAPAAAEGAQIIRLRVPLLNAERHLILVHLGG